VYFTPYLGGLIADRYIGYRRAVLLGGCFFAAGFFLMGIYSSVTFVLGLVCLCVGNGFFKPNISVMVGNLYAPGDPKRDAGFNIFYMGINIGALIAPILAATVRNVAGWLWIFRAAGIGMLVGIVILLVSWRALEAADRKPGKDPEDTPFSVIGKKILMPALVFGIGGYLLASQIFPESWQTLVRPAVCGFLVGMVPVLLFFVRLAANANEQEKPGLGALLPVYVAGGTFFMVLHLNGSAMTTWAKENTDRRIDIAPAMFQERAFPAYYDNAGEDEPRPNRKSLLAVESAEAAAMYGVRRMNEATLAAIKAAHADEIEVETVATQTGEDKTPAEQIKDELACDIYSEVTLEESADAHGNKEITVTPAEGAKKLKRVAFMREIEDDAAIPVFLVGKERYDRLYDGYRAKYGKAPEELPPGEYMALPNTELFQTVNPLFVVAFTPLVVWFFARRVARGRTITTARKIFYGMVLTVVALLVMALAAFLAGDGETKSHLLWLIAFYAIITTGELCLSPMALSLVTKLSPKRLVGLTMGGWFMAVAFGNNFSGFFGGLQGAMDPTPFFLVLAVLVAVVALYVYLLLPRLDAAMKKYGA
jgi:dipeptide/tripeptide permease